MKILLAPITSKYQRDLDETLIQNLIDVLRFNNHEVSLCVPEDYRFHHAKRYGAPAVSGLGLHRKAPRTYEEQLYESGVLDYKYLIKDVAALDDAVNREQPDLIIEYMRPQAIVTAKNHHIPCICLTHAAMIRERVFPPKILVGFNQFLNRAQSHQILRLKDLYLTAEQRIAFGPYSFQPFPDDFPVTYIGTRMPNPVDPTPDRKVVFYAGDLPISEKKCRKLIKEAYLGASYEVEAFIPGTQPGTDNNIRFQQTLRLATINDASLVIHDGSDLVTDACLTMGVPQLIINDTSWQKSWNAAACVRNGVGLSLNFYDLDMVSLYENDRKILSDPYYTERAQLLKNEVRSLGDLTELLKYLKTA